MTRKWTRLQEKYQEWLATPKSKRDPPLQMEMAEKLGRTPRTLQRWQKLPGFMDRVWELAQLATGKRLASLMYALTTRGIEGDVKAARLVLEATGRLQETPLIRQNVQAEELTVEDYARAARDVEAWKDEQER